jgi:hypothetical protein
MSVLRSAAALVGEWKVDTLSSLLCPSSLHLHHHGPSYWWRFQFDFKISLKTLKVSKLTVTVNFKISQQNNTRVRSNVSLRQYGTSSMVHRHS